MPRVITHNGYEIEAKAPGEYDDPNYWLAYDFDDDDVQAAVNELAPLCDEHRHRSFAWYYEMGKVVRKHREIVLTDLFSEETFRTRYYKRLARDLNRPDITDGLLRTCFRLVERFDEDEYMALRHHPEISTTHVLAVCGIENKDDRKELLDKVIAEKLTTRDLQRHMIVKFGRRRQPGGGRPLKTFKKVKDAMTHLKAQAEKYVSLHNKSWFNADFNLGENLKDEPIDKLMGDFKTEIEATAEKCRTLAETAAAEAAVLEEALNFISEREERQLEETARVEAEIREEAEAEDYVEPVAPSYRPPSIHGGGKNIGRAMHV